MGYYSKPPDFFEHILCRHGLLFEVIGEVYEEKHDYKKRKVNQFGREDRHVAFNKTRFVYHISCLIFEFWLFKSSIETGVFAAKI